ncbi:MAG: HEAT repeat domain-containing protein, partial [Candidatus Bathyarchaeia archaeon]
FYAGINGDATALIERARVEVPEDIFYNNLMFFGKCVAHAEFTKPALREKIINDLWALYQEAEFRPLWEKAINVLALIKPDSIIDSLIRNLKDEDSKVRARAAAALGNIGSEKAIEPLIYALTDRDSPVRRSAAFALGNIGSERAVEPLIYALADIDGDVRASAADALGRIGSEKAIETLIGALADRERDVRASA